MKGICGRPGWSMSGGELLSTLDAVQAEIARLQTYRLELLAELDSRGHAAEVGARDTATLIATRHRLDPREVRRDLRFALALPKYDAVRAALPSADADLGPGELHPAQGEAIVAALEKVPTAAKVPVETLRVAESELVKAAAVLNPADLRRLGRKVRDTLDPDGREPDEDRAHDAEDLWLKPGALGIEFGGYLAGDNGELLQTLIFAGAKPHQTPEGRRDPRSRGKRQADALTAILTTAAATGTAVPSHGGIRPHVTVTISLDDLISGTGTGDLAHGNTLSAAAVRRLACDAGIIPLVLGANSEPLDLGTQHRFVTPALRQALNARDRGCVICGAPPAMCEAHHLIHWANGGKTALTNLALLCKQDHHQVHRGNYILEMHQGRPRATTGPWTTPTTPAPNRPPTPQPTANRQPAAGETSTATPRPTANASPTGGTNRTAASRPTANARPTGGRRDTANPRPAANRRPAATTAATTATATSHPAHRNRPPTRTKPPRPPPPTTP
ncbi:HNH endonuclease signature motif containing protein [Kribbella amoyensis]|nr:HNH endonuclease signature motif containing protein [Kribbella amoyensis]